MRKSAITLIIAILVVSLAGCGKGGGASVDKTPPVISDISVSNVTQTSATITWETNEPATSQVEMDFVYPSGAISGENFPERHLVTNHSYTWTGLAANKTYPYRVKSSNAYGNETTSEWNTFTTAAFPDN